MKKRSLLFLSIFIILVSSMALADPDKKRIVMVIGSGDSLVVAEAFKRLNKLPVVSERYSLVFHTDQEIRNAKVNGGSIKDATIIMADFMHREINGFLARNIGQKGTKIYSLRCANLAEKLRKKGFRLETCTERYYSPPTIDNIKNLVLMILSREGEKVSYGKPFTLPASGIFHPDTTKIFPGFDEYLKWYRNSGKLTPNGFWVGIYTFHTSALKERGKMEACLIHALEKEGINVLPAFGRPPYHESLERFFIDKGGRPRVRTLCGFAFRFLRGFSEETKRILCRINAPVFIPLSAHAITIDQWKRSPKGISTIRVAWQVCIPEQNGAIEPSMVGGKRSAYLKDLGNQVFDAVPMPEYVEHLVRRIKAWHRLKAKSNKEKRIAILYWNHPPGKQNVGASYLNLFQSICGILSALKEDGYRIEKLPSEEEIKRRILLSGRNVASWAPGELDKLISAGGVVSIPITKYKAWFMELDPGFRQGVLDQWGRVEDSRIMVRNGEIIIPLVDLGNIILLPQPDRAFGDDAKRLYHDPKIYPHHQYVAFYLWLKKEFGADAIISLGKHGTHEWLPGKQIGLSLSCPPEVLIQDIPNIYPYIVDNIGEGIQAKRRGRGVIIDHMTPPFKKGGLYMEYRKLSSLIDEYHNAKSVDLALSEEKLKRVQELVRKLGLDRDLGLKKIDDREVEEVEHYILELGEKLIPYGLHTFGVSPEGESLESLAEAICLASPEIKKEEMRERLEMCGRGEMGSLLRALDGGYIPAGEGNDPVRNPEAVPTGRNFYGFNADKIPSREAFSLGKRLADKMIQGYVKKQGRYPDKLGIILWSTETQRNEGVNESAILNLLGITPVWDRKDRVVDLEPIPGAILKRPRIDVLVQASGLYRDSFPEVIKLLDRAVRMAGALRDVENFVAVNNKKIVRALLNNGYSQEDAEELSQYRIFAPMPGAYSHALQELIPNSGVWEDEKEIADVFIHHYSFAYGDKLWGRPLKSAYKSNLEDVDITMHSRSSNLYYMLDNDDMFAFLGGLSLAVKTQRGEYPDVQVANHQNGKEIKLESLSRSIGKALRTRYLNPEWIKGMKKEGYAGARAMDKFVEYLWGFQVTTPFAVDRTDWRQIYEVYIKDRYDLNLKEFFDRNNPWAEQSIAARMLEAIRKRYWDAPELIKKDLARTYAINVIEKGMACCEHTCNNPMLQQFVANVISLFGLLTPEQLDQFKMVLSKATGKGQEQNEADMKRLQSSLAKTIKEIQKNEDPKAHEEGKRIEGFEMVEEKGEEPKIAASGASWVVMAIVVSLLALLFLGWKRMKV